MCVHVGKWTTSSYFASECPASSQKSGVEDMGRMVVWVMQQASAEVTCRVVEVAWHVEVLGELRMRAILMNRIVGRVVKMERAAVRKRRADKNQHRQERAPRPWHSGHQCNSS